MSSRTVPVAGSPARLRRLVTSTRQPAVPGQQRHDLARIGGVVQDDQDPAAGKHGAPQRRPVIEIRRDALPGHAQQE
jgi:hypothetical protein